ncbi:LacI family DNA-binding transcriptional regulator [Schaalia suimastitidis]|uniref:LacI family DNA-binding transcriptional regulator n=1 Tax=Schaalia suimastitidis TaxID=121163 RepID=UPI0003FFB259|nr:LacI family DNA-binding transcriptional regulator [Schaalia suimastitidis]
MARPRSTDRPPSIHDVAAQAGVSHQTVSRVLNNKGRVAESTKEKVRQVIQELGYRRNTVARALSTRRSGILGVVTTNKWYYGPTSILLSVEIAARDAGYYTVVAPVDDSDSDAITTACERFLTLPVEGIILIAPGRLVHSELWGAQMSVPFVAVTSNEPEKHSGAITIEFDQYEAARQAMEHLFDLGHTDIAHIAGPADSIHARIREDVWATAMKLRGLPLRPIGVRGWGADVGYEQGKALLATPWPTAVFCGNDEVAAGFYAACDEAGARIPQDISVIGFDNEPTTAYYRPALTTVAQDFPELGRAIVSTMRDAIDNGPVSGRQHLSARLILRDSTAAPRQEA